MSHYRRRYAARRKQTKAAGGEYEERKSIQLAPPPKPAFILTPPKVAAVTNEKTTIPEGAACYICLDDGPDEEGKPLVRDCSCRGDDAGFVHLSCLIDYAQQKSKDFLSFSGTPESLWLVCPNCEQRYQNQLAKDMSREFLSFAEKSHRELENSEGEKDEVQKFVSQIRVMDAMKEYSDCREIIDEDPLFPWMVGKDSIANRVLSIVEQMRKDFQMPDQWLHAPKGSLEHVMYRVLRGRCEAYAYCALGGISYREGTAVGYKRAISYMEKARVISTMLGKEKSAQMYKCRIDHMKYMREGRSTALQVSKNIYENSCQVEDEFSPNNITLGLMHVSVLKEDGNIAEAVELATKLATSSRRVHGPQHKCTVDAENVLNGLVDTYEGGDQTILSPYHQYCK